MIRKVNFVSFSLFSQSHGYTFLLASRRSIDDMVERVYLGMYSLLCVDSAFVMYLLHLIHLKAMPFLVVLKHIFSIVSMCRFTLFR